MCVVDVTHYTLIFKFRLVSGQTGLDVLGVTMVESAVFDADEVVRVFLRLHFAVRDGLDRGVVMLLVNFLVDSGSDILMLCAVDILMSNTGRDIFVHGSVMVTSFVPIRRWSIPEVKAHNTFCSCVHELIDGDLGFGGHDDWSC